jgi:hypothetical protein
MFGIVSLGQKARGKPRGPSRGLASEHVAHLYPVVHVVAEIEALSKEQAVVGAVSGFNPLRIHGLGDDVWFADEFHDPVVVDVEGDEEHEETTEHYHGDGQEVSKTELV